MSSKIGEEISMPNLQWSKNDPWENYNQLLVFLSGAEKGNACLTKGLTRMLDCMVRGDSPSDQEALAAADLQGGDSEQPERGLQGGEPVNRRTVFQYNTPTSASTSPLATLTLATTWKMPSSKWPKFKVAQVSSGPSSKWPKFPVDQVPSGPSGPSGPSSQWPKFPVAQSVVAPVRAAGGKSFKGGQVLKRKSSPFEINQNLRTCLSNQVLEGSKNLERMKVVSS